MIASFDREQVASALFALFDRWSVACVSFVRAVAYARPMDFTVLDPVLTGCFRLRRRLPFSRI